MYCGEVYFLNRSKHLQEKQETALGSKILGNNQSKVK